MTPESYRGMPRNGTPSAAGDAALPMKDTRKNSCIVLESGCIIRAWGHSSAGMSVRLTRERSWVRAPLAPLRTADFLWIKGKSAVLFLLSWKSFHDMKRSFHGKCVVSVFWAGYNEVSDRLAAVGVWYLSR